MQACLPRHLCSPRYHRSIDGLCSCCVSKGRRIVWSASGDRFAGAVGGAVRIARVVRAEQVLIVNLERLPMVLCGERQSGEQGTRGVARGWCPETIGVALRERLKAQDRRAFVVLAKERAPIIRARTTGDADGAIATYSAGLHLNLCHLLVRRSSANTQHEPT